MNRSPARTLAVAVALIVTAACGSSGGGHAIGPSPSATTPTLSPLPHVPAPIDPRIRGTRNVRFPSSDRVQLAGRVFGSGSHGVILGHMGSPSYDESQWWDLAVVLAKHGYRVMTFDFRGICPKDRKGCSQGSVDFVKAPQDMEGAMAFMRAHGVRTLAIGGASLGAMAALLIASRPGTQADAVISVSGVQQVDGYPLDRATISAITEPTLYVAGKTDPEGAPALRHWVGWAQGPVVAKLLGTSLHGTDMLVPIAPEDQGVPRLLEHTVLSFLARYG